MIQMSDDGNVYILNGKIYTRTGSATTWSIATGITNVAGIMSGNGLTIVDESRILEATDQTWSSVTITNLTAIGGSMVMTAYPFTSGKQVYPVAISFDGTKIISVFSGVTYASGATEYRGKMYAGFAVKISGVWQSGSPTFLNQWNRLDSEVYMFHTGRFISPCQYTSSNLETVVFRWDKTGTFEGTWANESLMGLRSSLTDPTGYTVFAGPQNQFLPSDPEHASFVTFVSKDGTSIYRTYSYGFTKHTIASNLTVGSGVTLSHTGIAPTDFVVGYSSGSVSKKVAGGGSDDVYMDTYNAPASIILSTGFFIPLTNTGTNKSSFAQVSFDGSGVATVHRAGPIGDSTTGDRGTAYNGYYIMRTGSTTPVTGNTVKVYNLNL